MKQASAQSHGVVRVHFASPNPPLIQAKRGCKKPWSGLPASPCGAQSSAFTLCLTASYKKQKELITVVQTSRWPKHFHVEIKKQREFLCGWGRMSNERTQTHVSLAPSSADRPCWLWPSNRRRQQASTDAQKTSFSHSTIRIFTLNGCFCHLARSLLLIYHSNNTIERLLSHILPFK